MKFVDAFVEHVTPRLQREAKFRGTQLALDLTTWNEAADGVMDVARQHGASHLPDPILDELVDWIDIVLLHEQQEAENLAGKIATEAETNPITHYENLAQSCANPDAMRWTFAAISPEYRAHLLAAKRGR